MMKRWLGILAAGAALAGCGGGQGSVEFTTWGEDYIETQIPASVFADAIRTAGGEPASPGIWIGDELAERTEPGLAVALPIVVEGETMAVLELFSDSRVDPSCPRRALPPRPQLAA